MADKPHWTAEQVRDALEETQGMVFMAAKRLGCSFQTVLNYCERHPTVNAVRKAKRGEMVDASELKLWQAIQKGEPWAIAMVLKTLGKDRGYVERSELTGANGGPVELLVIQGDLGSGNSDPVQIPHVASSTNGVVHEHEAL